MSPIFCGIGAVMMVNVTTFTTLYHMNVLSLIHLLSLAENSISNKGAKALSRALLVNRTLTSLK